jgi:hypothetical protein
MDYNINDILEVLSESTRDSLYNTIDLHQTYITEGVGTALLSAATIYGALFTIMSLRAELINRKSNKKNNYAHWR